MTKKKTPPVEQPSPDQPSSSQPGIAEVGKAAAEGAAPIAPASPEAQAPALELTPQNLAAVINQLAQNQNVLMAEIKRLRDDVSSMRGSYSQKRIDPNINPAAPQQQTPEALGQLAPLALAAISKWVGGPEATPEETMVTAVAKELTKASLEYVTNAIRNGLALQQAAMEGRVLITDKPGVPKPQ